MTRNDQLKQIAGIVTEVVRRIKPPNTHSGDWQYCILRRSADNDLLVLGPFTNLANAAAIARDTDTVKPMFQESDLA